MNNIQKRNPYISGYPDIFFCMEFDYAEVCRHTFDTHVLLYVYSGTLELYDGYKSETISAGGCVFVQKGEELNISVYPSQDGTCHIMKMIIPRGFLCELYHCGYEGYDFVENETKFSGHVLSDNAAVTSLFQSLVPFYEAGMEIPQSLHRLKLTEAVLALLSENPGFHRYLFDFAYAPMNLLDVVKTTEAKPMNWVKIATEMSVVLS